MEEQIRTEGREKVTRWEKTKTRGKDRKEDLTSYSRSLKSSICIDYNWRSHVCACVYFSFYFDCIWFWSWHSSQRFWCLMRIFGEPGWNSKTQLYFGFQDSQGFDKSVLTWECCLHPKVPGISLLRETWGQPVLTALWVSVVPIQQTLTVLLLSHRLCL